MDPSNFTDNSERNMRNVHFSKDVNEQSTTSSTASDTTSDTSSETISDTKLAFSKPQIPHDLFILSRQKNGPLSVKAALSSLIPSCTRCGAKFDKITSKFCSDCGLAKA